MYYNEFISRDETLHTFSCINEMKRRAQIPNEYLTIAIEIYREWLEELRLDEEVIEEQIYYMIHILPKLAIEYFDTS